MENKRGNKTGLIAKTRNTVEPYTSIPNRIIQNPELSMRAKSVLVYIFSLPYDFVVYRSEIVHHFSDGKYAVYAAFDELIEKGYVIAIQMRDIDTGRFIGYNYVPYDQPQLLVNQPQSDLPNTVD